MSLLFDFNNPNIWQPIKKYEMRPIKEAFDFNDVLDDEEDELPASSLPEQLQNDCGTEVFDKLNIPYAQSKRYNGTWAPAVGLTPEDTENIINVINFNTIDTHQKIRGEYDYNMQVMYFKNPDNPFVKIVDVFLRFPYNPEPMQCEKLSFGLRLICKNNTLKIRNLYMNATTDVAGLTNELLIFEDFDNASQCLNNIENIRVTFQGPYEDRPVHIGLKDLKGVEIESLQDTVKEKIKFPVIAVEYVRLNEDEFFGSTLKAITQHIDYNAVFAKYKFKVPSDKLLNSKISIVPSDLENHVKYCNKVSNVMMYLIMALFRCPNEKSRFSVIPLHTTCETKRTGSIYLTRLGMLYKLFSFTLRNSIPCELPLALMAYMLTYYMRHQDQTMRNYVQFAF